MEIQNKERVFSTGQYNRMRVDYGESRKQLIRIIKDVDIKLHDKYINKEISYKEFIKRSKKYTYNREENKNKPKWIIYYVNDRVSYIIWKKKFAGIKNRGLYWFTPTKFINTSDRLRETLFKTFKCEDDTIEHDKIGIVDKLNMLLKFNDKYYLKFER